MKTERELSKLKEVEALEALREELKFYMAEKDLNIQDVADLIKREYKTVWKFLTKRVKSQERTIYKIKKLLGARRQK